MIEMTEEQLKTLKWETITNSVYHEKMGIKTIGKVRRIPGCREDHRHAIVGINGILRGEYVHLHEETPDGKKELGLVFCRVVGINKMGCFLLNYVDPPTPDDIGKTFAVKPFYCTPASPDFGKRLMPELKR